jgi:hypothetical protein
MYDNKPRLDNAKPDQDQATMTAKRERLAQLDIRPAVTVYKNSE